MGYSRFFHLRKEQAARLLKQRFEVHDDKLRCVAASLGVGHSVYIELSEYQFRDEVVKVPLVTGGMIGFEPDGWLEGYRSGVYFCLSPEIER